MSCVHLARTLDRYTMEVAYRVNAKSGWKGVPDRVANNIQRHLGTEVYVLNRMTRKDF